MNKSESNPRKKNTTFRILVIFSVLSFFAAAGAIFHHIRYQQETLANIKADLQELTTKATKDIDTIVRQAMCEVDNVANNLTNGRLKKRRY